MRTLTIRTNETLREALKERAKFQGKTVSEVVREILEEAVLERPLGPRAGHQLSSPTDPWREEIRARNWRS